MITVVGLSITPLKGTRLHAPSDVFLGPEGVAENRRFYLIDDDGRLVNARQAGALMRVWAESNPEGHRLALHLPDGDLVEGDVAPGEPIDTDFWGRDVRGCVCPGPWEDALSALCRRHVRVVRAERAGDACDRHRVTLVSRASLEELAGSAGNEATGDGRRFRMLITLNGCAAREEDGWSDRRLRVGEAVLRIGGTVPRCVVTTLSPDTGRRDLDTLRAIRDLRGRGEGGSIDFGVYAEVEEPGRVRVGDDVRDAT